MRGEQQSCWLLDHAEKKPRNAVDIAATRHKIPAVSARQFKTSVLANAPDAA